MRIKGPGDGPRPPDAVDEAAPVDGVDETAAGRDRRSRARRRHRRTADRAESTRSPRSRRGCAPARSPSDEALELLIDDTITRQLGMTAGGAVTQDLEPKLREVLRDYAANDPFLAAKIRKLTQRR